MIDSSKEILSRAIAEFNPNAIMMMLSGGDDSLTAYHVAKELGVKFDFVIHGNTRTGIQQTTEFARAEVERMGDKYIEADAGSDYEDYVLRKGFFGRGLTAHNYAFHVLKMGHFRKAVSRHIRKGKRNVTILFVNGARRQESENRLKTMKKPYREDPSQKKNIWVNIINEWTKQDCRKYLEGNDIKRNPVSVNLCRSGECMCGTMQSNGDRLEAKYFYPKWGQWLDDLEAEVIKKFPWRWGEEITKTHLMEKEGQMNMFQPMCQGCKTNFKI